MEKPDTIKEIKFCLNCPVLNECNQSDPLCPYRKPDGLTAQQRYYEKLKQDPERLKRLKAKWHKNYIERKRANGLIQNPDL